MPCVIILASSGGLAGPFVAGLLVLALGAIVCKVLDLHIRLVRFYAGPPRVEDRVTQLVACAAAAQYGPGWLHSLDQCRRDTVVRRIAEVYFRGADGAALRNAARAQLETWLEQRTRTTPVLRQAAMIAYGVSLGSVAIGLMLAVSMVTGVWTPPGAIALVAFLGVMGGFPTLGICRAMLDDRDGQTAAGVLDRELIVTAFVGIIENADSAEVEARLRRVLPATGAAAADVSKVA